MDVVYDIVVAINSYLSNYVLVILLVAMGLWFTVRTRFVQVRCFGEGIRRVFGGFSLHGGSHKSGISSFQALATAVAAQVGTGNIVGACGAILLGGPGAIFWMWLIAFLGMATNYAEAVLAQETRKVDADGTVHGGPVYYIKRAFSGTGGKFLAGFFAVSIILALGFMGCMVQSNSIAATCNTAFGIPTWAMGLFVVFASGVVFIGGLQRLAGVTEKLVPIMALVYLVGGMIVLVLNAANIPGALALIFSQAFTPAAGLSGGIFAAISQGAKRGLFSNEAGMGSTPHAHAMANVKDPHHQGVAAMIGVFIDTFVVVSMTALVVISVLYVGADAPLAIDLTGKTFGLDKTNMAQVAFGTFFGQGIGNGFVAICLLMFAFSTILGWNLFAKLNVEYLFKRFGKKAVTVFSIIALCFIFLGSILSNDLVWELADLFNQLMVIPNSIALFALSGAVIKCARAHKHGEPIEVDDGNDPDRSGDVVL